MQALALLGSWAVAIYHFDLASLSRAAGQSVVRAWAYISGTRQTDERTGRVADYSRKAGEVLAVGSVGTADWQAAEAAEKRKDAKVGRSIILALPCELGLVAHRALVDGFGTWLREQHGIAVGWAIHAPPSDPRNTHAHLLLSTRAVDENGVYGAKVRDLDRSATSTVIIKNWRLRWEQFVNRGLAEQGETARVDARSHQAAGHDAIAREHLGPHRAAQARKGYGVLAVARNAAAAAVNSLIWPSPMAALLTRTPPPTRIPSPAWVTPSTSWRWRANHFAVSNHNQQKEQNRTPCRRSSIKVRKCRPRWSIT